MLLIVATNTPLNSVIFCSCFFEGIDPELKDGCSMPCVYRQSIIRIMINTGRDRWFINNLNGKKLRDRILRRLPWLRILPFPIGCINWRSNGYVLRLFARIHVRLLP